MRSTVLLLLLARAAAADVTPPATGKAAPVTCLAALDEARRSLVSVEPRLAAAQVRKELGTGHIALRPVGLWVVWDDYKLRFEDPSGVWLALYVGLPHDQEYNAPLTWGLTLPTSARTNPALCDRTSRSHAAASLCADGIDGATLAAIEKRLKSAVAICFATVDNDARPPRWERMPDELIKNSRR
jgi:hypothetical protein